MHADPEVEQPDKSVHNRTMSFAAVCDRSITELEQWTNVCVCPYHAPSKSKDPGRRMGKKPSVERDATHNVLIGCTYRGIYRPRPRLYKEGGGPNINTEDMYRYT